MHDVNNYFEISLVFGILDFDEKDAKLVDPLKTFIMWGYGNEQVLGDLIPFVTHFHCMCSFPGFYLHKNDCSFMPF